MPADKFSPNGNPQDRAKIIDPATFLPPDFQPVYGNPDDAQAALDAVKQEIQLIQSNGGTWNQVTDTLLSVVGKLLGTVI